MSRKHLFSAPLVLALLPILLPLWVMHLINPYTILTGAQNQGKRIDFFTFLNDG